MDSNRQKRNDGKGGFGGGLPQILFGLLIALVISYFISVIASGSTSQLMGGNQSELSYSEFLAKVKQVIFIKLLLLQKIYLHMRKALNLIQILL